MSDSELVNKQEFIIFGLRRGGQHAVINWLAAHFPDKVHFANNLWDFSKPEIYEDREGMYDQRLFHDPSKIPGFWRVPKDVLFQSYEDIDLDRLDFAANESVVGKSGKRTCILVIRDPYNLVASRRKIVATGRGDRNVFHDDILWLWKQHAREALGECTIPGRVVISFNHWFKSERYRRRIESTLGLRASDRCINDVCGLGSSFDGKTKHGKASEMDVLNRWKSLMGDEEVCLQLRDGEIQALAVALFGDVPDEFKSENYP